MLPADTLHGVLPKQPGAAPRLRPRPGHGEARAARCRGGGGALEDKKTKAEEEEEEEEAVRARASFNPYDCIRLRVTLQHPVVPTTLTVTLRHHVNIHLVPW